MVATKALFAEQFDAARTALTDGDEAAAAGFLQAAIGAARGDPGLRRELASALFHLGKISRRLGPAGEVEAEPLLTEALAISEGLFGREHPALAPLLNALSRLYVQRSQHARAEDVLERLLAIARADGEENADVAVALAGLALVKRKLGDDASAEALYRDALRIREHALEPNHMVTVVTLEQLSETCAARGNVAEALALLRRALATREATLGRSHATVQAAQSRAAELELRIADAAAASGARGAKAAPASFERVPDFPVNTPSTSVPSPISTMKLEFLGEPEPRVVRPAPLSRERAKTPAVAAAVAAASLMASSIQTPSASWLALSPPESARLSASVTARESGAPYQDAVRAEVAQGHGAGDDAALGEWQSTVTPAQAHSPEAARKKRPVLYASAGAAVIATVGLLMLLTRAGGGSAAATEISSAPRSTAAGAPRVTESGAVIGSTLAGAAATAGVTRADSLRSASAALPRSAPVVQPEQRAPMGASPELRVRRVDVHLGAINVPSTPVPTISAPSVDSIMRADSERLRAADTARPGTGDGVSLPTSADVDAPRTPARIIGRMPEPRFPEALLRAKVHEGQVVVSFMVNELGRVDLASMTVERSDNELFTASVRDILPLIRFEPARTRAPESRPVAAWVSVPFRFTTKK